MHIRYRVPMFDILFACTHICEWLDENEEELSIEAAESGADREMGFDFETFAERRFDKLIQAEHQRKQNP